MATRPKRPSLSFREEIANARRKRDESQKCKAECSLRRDAGDESRERTSKQIGLHELPREYSPLIQSEGGTVGPKMVYPAATKHPTRLTATGIKPEI